MTFPSIPAGSFAGMIFTTAASILLPIVLWVAACWKLKEKPNSILMGCAAFVIFALILEQSLHSVVLNNIPAVQENTWLYFAYGSLAAALFEETGRFLAMKYFMRDRLNEKSALLYGLGHGGMEAILVIGITYVNNLVIAGMIQSGQMESALAGMDAASAEAAVESVSSLWTLPSYQFFLAGVERILAMVLQLALSMFVFQAVRGKKMGYYALALAVHFGVNFITAMAAQFIDPVYVEGILLLLVLAAAFGAWQVTKKERDGHGAPVE